MKIWLFNIAFILISLLSVHCQDQIVFKSDLIYENDTVWVFKPADYCEGMKYPAVYMLHGWSGNYKSWNELINLQNFASKYRWIILCPDGLYDSYYLNSPLIKNSQFESFFVNELYPAMVKKYSIDSGKIFITGLSMGGGGAMYLFLKHPDMFLSAGSTSGLMDLGYSLNRDGRLSKLLGEYKTNREVFSQYSSISLIENIKGKNKPVYIDCGTEDLLYSCNVAFKLKCDSLNIPVIYNTTQGGHNSDYWKNSIVNHFDFFKGLMEIEE